MTRRPALVLPLVLVGLTTACELPRFEGPQIQEPPIGFLLQEDSYLQRPMFPDREVSFHTAWVHTDLGGVSVIYLNGHAGSTTLDDVIAAQQGVQAAATDRDRRFGPVEALTIDGRDAWGWEERVESTTRGLVDVAYRAVIPYDTITFAIEFESGEPKWKAGSPDSLRAVVGSFGIGRTTYNIPLIAIGAGALLLLLNVARTRAKERDQRLRSINLVQVPKDEETEEGESDGAAAPSRRAGPPAPPAGPPPSPGPSDPSTPA